MNVVRMTYSDTEMEPSVYLKLFLQFTGVFVTERFLENSAIRKDILDACDVPVFSSYDCDICIARDERDLKSSKMREYAVMLTKGFEADGSIDYMACKGTELLYAVTGKLMEAGILPPEEKEDLDLLADVYDTCGMMGALLKTKYFFTYDKKMVDLKPFSDSYEKAISALEELMRDNHVKWGERRFLHLQYAMLYAIYELCNFQRRHWVGLSYHKDTMPELCSRVMSGADGLLGESVRMLKGRIYDDLFSQRNDSYEQYAHSQVWCGGYDYHLYMLKGAYWEEFGLDYGEALKWYEKAVHVSPQYHGAWYKVGICNEELGKKADAVTAYENTRRCLSGRMNSRCISPVELSYVFVSETHIAQLWEGNENFTAAMDALTSAISCYDMVDDIRFYDLMCDTPEEKAFYRSVTKKNLDIGYAYDRLITVALHKGDHKTADAYQQKLDLLRGWK